MLYGGETDGSIISQSYPKLELISIENYMY
jgi:hypothetical protein